jgi:hypothetical protein
MTPHFIRLVLAILAVRALSISPAQGSEFAPSSLPSASSQERLEAVRYSLPQFTHSCPPTASQERLDCIDGGEDGDKYKRTHLSHTSMKFWCLGTSSRPIFSGRIPDGTLACAFVRLRC